MVTDSHQEDPELILTTLEVELEGNTTNPNAQQPPTESLFTVSQTFAQQGPRLAANHHETDETAENDLQLDLPIYGAAEDLYNRLNNNPVEGKHDSDCLTRSEYET